MILVKDEKVTIGGTIIELATEICGAIEALADEAKNNDVPQYLFTKAILDAAIEAIKNGYEKGVRE